MKEVSIFSRISIMLIYIISFGIETMFEIAELAKRKSAQEDCYEFSKAPTSQKK